jgi:hypothetical protein
MDQRRNDRQQETEILGETPVTVPLGTPQTSSVLNWDQIRAFAENRLSHIKEELFKFKLNYLPTFSSYRTENTQHSRYKKKNHGSVKCGETI